MEKLYAVTLKGTSKKLASLSGYIGWLGFWGMLIAFFIKEIIIEKRFFMIFFIVLMLLAGTLMNLAYNEIFKEKRAKLEELTETNVYKGYSRAVTGSLCCLVASTAAALFEAVIPYFYPHFEALPYVFIMLCSIILCSVLQFIGFYFINKSVKPIGEEE